MGRRLSSALPHFSLADIIKKPCMLRKLVAIIVWLAGSALHGR